MVRTRLSLGFSRLSIFTLVFARAIAGCDAKSHGDDDDDDAGTSGEGATGGTSSNQGGTTGQGGSTSGGTGKGGSTSGSANGGSANGGSANGGTSASGSGNASTLGGTGNGGTGMGDAGSSGDGTGDTGGSSANGGSGGTVIGPICDAIDVKLELETPTVMLLVDTSTSMFEVMPPVYPVLHDSLMNAMSGVVEHLQGKMRFGFAAYEGHKATSETDPVCATMLTVDPALDNYAAIEEVYGSIAWDPEAAPKWETPTNYAINYASAALQADTPAVPSNKYILLVTDGNPNTCQTVDPQCGQDRAIKAAQDAYAAGIGMMVLGVGDIVENPNSGCASSYQRCGLEHLQDMANAGVGAPVMPPPTCDDPTSASCASRYLPCNDDQTLHAAYTPNAEAIGHYVAVDTTEGDATQLVSDAVIDLLNDVTACTFHMNVAVTGDASTGVVKLDGAVLAFGAADGWAIAPSNHELALRGAACAAFTDGAELSVDLPCDQIEPLAP